MNGRLLAHSARPNRGIPAQGFWEHIDGVTRRAAEFAARASALWSGDGRGFVAEVRAAAQWHDCGKLAPENQRVLGGVTGERLPIRHEDAGTHMLLQAGWKRAAIWVASHHAGLPSEPEERKKKFIPPGLPYRLAEAAEHTARHEGMYREEYSAAGITLDGDAADGAWSGLAHRMALSCLIDGDHSDTAAHYGEATPARAAPPRWGERRAALDNYVESLRREQEGERADERRAVYDCCRGSEVDASIVSCEAAVGAGKTTAVMAYLLGWAERRKLRHIFVVVPFTNIIEQSAEVYRTALILEGENAAEVVAEVHHRAEFEDPDLREMSVLWDAPITVTTAVQFFETIAASHPARLRKLHELAGSAVFLDEAHATIPAWLWPQTWLWMKELTRDWGCQFVLGSGSLARFWENPDFIRGPEMIPDLLTPELRRQLREREERRVEIRSEPAPFDCDGLIGFLDRLSGPRLAILNTVQSAAVLAKRMREAGKDVLHISTALAPKDRERILKRIRARLNNKNDPEWTLVATSCVEAGVDISFRSAVRESCSVSSAIQTGGRVNRHGEWGAAEVWDVRLSDAGFNHHPAFEHSRRVLERMIGRDELKSGAAEVVTEAMRRELIEKDVSEGVEKLKKAERLSDWPEVSRLYRVINADTKTVVVDEELVRRIQAGERPKWRELVRGSIQMWASKVDELKIRELDRDRELYYWTGPYEPEFLGYMAGVLPLVEGKDSGYFA